MSSIKNWKTIFDPNETGINSESLYYHNKTQFVHSNAKITNSGIDSLLFKINNTIRDFHTTYNHYSSDVLKSF